MNAYKIDHIGIAVASIDDALAIYRALGLQEKHREEVASQKVLTAFLPAGESSIELLQPTAEDSPVAKFLARRGQGIHHICFGVRDIEASIAELQRQGFRLINSRPAPGADGKKIVFLHPDSGNGVLIELSQAAGAAAP
ncbi:MAG TPA: methylmalonyl-CoA epimerase [Thermoanaerobaculia bacterium]|nr:methylmalonyl-CoA epimerase [Thermoanaerobaculia bacterium]